MKHTRNKLIEFIAESNRIEGITRPPTQKEIQAHEIFLELREVTVSDVEEFVDVVVNKRLRRHLADDVVIGGHFAPPGGPGIETGLEMLLVGVNTWDLTPFEAHVRYELLHPFLDGNGRSGRVLWAWMMKRDGLNPFLRPFLQSFYYQALDNAR